MNSPYFSWKGMMARCYHPGNHKFHRYGGRGITVCKSWHKYENFLADMGNRPDGKTLDRIDNNNGYSPENCKWSTVKQQNRNRVDNRIISFNGREKTITEWASIAGIGRTTIRKRLDLGWSAEKAITTPVRKKS